MGLVAGCPAREPKHQPGELVGQLPGTPVPGGEVAMPAAPGETAAPGPTGGATKAPAGDEKAAKGPETKPAAPQPMAEEKFVALSAKLVLASKTVPDNETGRKQLEDYTAQVLKENGVTTEEFQSFTNQIQHDEPRRQRIAAQIIARARQYAAPAVKAKLKVASPEKANPGG